MAGPKPAVAPTAIATNANFSAGPDIGTPTKVGITGAQQADGFLPGQKLPGQNFNSIENINFQWNDWVDAGTPAADLDDHIVETDATGETAVAALTVGGTAFGSQGLTVSGNAAGPAVGISNTNGNFGLTCSSDGALAAGNFTQTGTAPALRAFGLGTNNMGLQAQGAGTGNGLEADGGSGGGAGAVCTAGDDSSFGVDAFSDGVTTTNGGAIRATSTDNGIGVDVTVADGYGLVFAIAGGRAPIQLGSIAGAPTTTVAESDFWYDSVASTLAFGGSGAAANRVNANECNLFENADDSPNGGGSTAGATQQGGPTITIDPGGVSKRFLITATVFLDSNNDDNQVQVDINNGSGDVYSALHKLPAIGAGAARGMSVVAQVIETITNSTTYEIQLTNVGANGTMTWADAVISYTTLDN